MTRINTWALTTLDSSGDKPLGAPAPLFPGPQPIPFIHCGVDWHMYNRSTFVYSGSWFLAITPYYHKVHPGLSSTTQMRTRRLYPRNHTFLSQGSLRIILHYTNEDTLLVFFRHARSRLHYRRLHPYLSNYRPCLIHRLPYAPRTITAGASELDTFEIVILILAGNLEEVRLPVHCGGAMAGINEAIH